MKKLLYAICLVAFAFNACRPSYSCECRTANGIQQQASYGQISYNTAKNRCSSLQQNTQGDTCWINAAK